MGKSGCYCFREERVEVMRKLIEKYEALNQLAEANEADCKSKYVDPKTGRFKGGKGERFDNCVKYMKCKGGVDDPDAVCGKIARAKGEGVEYGPDDMDLLLTEAERAQKALVVRAADAMVNSPNAQRYLGKLPLAGYELQLQQTIEAMLTQLLQAKGIGVSGGAEALRSIRALGRGTMPS
jgi:hypothetical protein